MKNVTQTLLAAVITACLTVLTALTINSYIEPKPDNIANNPEASLRQAEAQSPDEIATQASTSDPASDAGEAEIIPPSTVHYNSNAEIVGICHSFEGAASSTITARDGFVPKEQVLQALDRNTSLSEDSKNLIFAMTLDVYDNPNGLTEGELIQSAYAHCLRHYGYSQ
jgi:hypothetical protein